MDRAILINKASLALLAMQRHSWEQGVTAQAFLELGEIDTVIALAKEAVYRANPDGRLAMVESDNQVTDPGSNGESVLAAYKATGDPVFKTAADKMLDYLLHTGPRAADGTLYHVYNAPEHWIDSGYMAPPFIALAGHPAEACQQIAGLRQRLWQPVKQMYAHIWDEGRQVFVRQACWGVGNGWMAAGIVRVLSALPVTMSDWHELLVCFLKDVLSGCLAHQRPDGLFHDVVDDPSTFVETNLAQMLAYSIYRGLQYGWLDSNYAPVADRLRAAAESKVDGYGLVQGVCGAPSFDKSGVAPEGQAFFLLMEAAYRDWAPKSNLT